MKQKLVVIMAALLIVAAPLAGFLGWRAANPVTQGPTPPANTTAWLVAGIVLAVILLGVGVMLLVDSLSKKDGEE